MKKLKDFLNFAILLPINDNVIDKTIEIRQNLKIGLGDSLIAATAIVNELVLITRNVSDFKKVEGLKVIDSFSTFS